MKKRKIVLGIAMAAALMFSLASCDDMNINAPIVEADGGATGGNTTGGATGGNTTGGTTGGNTTGGTTGGNTTGGEGKSQTEAGYSDVDGSGQFSNVTGQIEFTKALGDLESAYVVYNEFSNATAYNAYVKADGASSYTKLDSQLTRKYKDGSNTYMRTDVLGLKAGKYSLKVVPVVGGQEAESAASVATNISVSAHIRDGFGFVNGTSSGAYNNDGTLKSNADVLYVAESNKDTIKYTGHDSKGNAVEYTGIQNIIAGMKGQKTINNPICIRFIGNITDPASMPKGDLYVDGAKDLTIEGVGNDATMNGFGIVIKGSSNIEIRNLGFMNCNSSEGDDCGLQQDNDHVWVHNCDFFYGDAGSDADQVKGDGALDTKKSTYVTHSYNHFFDNGKCNLQGMKSETAENYITYHHNWYDHSDSRHPRVRTCTVHVYNNYFDGNAKYCIGSALGASIFAENNYFRSTSNTIPFMTGLMAHDNKEEGGHTLSDEAGGVIKEYGNYFDGSFRYTKYSDNNNDFDAYNASSRGEIVSSSVKSPANKPYNNFDTASTMYSYTLHTPQDAKASILKYAGRIDGGDLHWTFTDEDDAAYAVNTALKAALVGYKTKLVSVQDLGAATQGGSTNPVTPTTTAEDVIALIDALPEATTVTESNRSAINSAKAAYDALDATEQTKVTNYDKLTACIAALPLSVDFRNATGITTGSATTIYENPSIKVYTTTKVTSIDDKGLKFDSNKTFTVKNKTEGTLKVVLTLVGNGKGKKFDYGTQTISFDTTAVELELTLEAGKEVTFTSGGGAYLQALRG